MDLRKQTLMLGLLVSSPDLFTICSSIIKKEYFDVELRNAVEFIKEYSEDHNAIPPIELIEVETGITLKTTTLSKDIIQHASLEIEKFCKRQSMENAVMASVKFIQEDNHGEVQRLVSEALLVGLKKDLGLNYLENPEERLERLLVDQIYLSTGIYTLDELLGGGLVRKQLTIFSGNSGVGKSITLTNLAVNYAKAGLNVLCLTLELDEDMVSLRTDGIMAGFKQNQWKDHINDTCRILNDTKNNSNSGEIYIKYMPSGTRSNEIRSYLKEFELQNGYSPDVLIVDYLDIMGTNANISPENMFVKDKYASEELRSILNDYNMIGISASQQNRGAIDNLEPNQSNVAGGISKVNSSDFWLSILATPKMKAEGVIGYLCLKARSSSGEGNTALASWDDDTLKIGNIDDKTHVERGLKLLNAKKEQVESEIEFEKKTGIVDLNKFSEMM